MKAFELYATLSLDTSEFGEGLNQAGKEMKSLGDTLNAKTVAIGTAVGNLVTSAVKTAAKGAVQLAKQAVEASAEVSAENAQFAATFGDMADAAEEAYGKIGKETNILTTRLRATGTKGFAQLTGAGVSASEALDTSAQMLQLSADAAAYYDITLEAADERIRSFMRGNTEAGDAIGLFTSETQRNTRAMELYKKKWAELTEAQRQNLMLNVAQEIYEQSGVIGQAAREGHEWLNVTENLSESWRQTLANLGEPLKNALIPGIEKVTELLSSSEVQEKIGQIGEAVGEFATDALSALIDGLDWCVDNQDQVESAANGIGKGLLALAAIKFPGITALIATLNSLGVINLTGQSRSENGNLVTEDGTEHVTLGTLVKTAYNYVKNGSEKLQEKMDQGYGGSMIDNFLNDFGNSAGSVYKILKNELWGFLGIGYDPDLLGEEIQNLNENWDKLEDAYNRGAILEDKNYDLADSKRLTNPATAETLTGMSAPGVGLVLDTNKNLTPEELKRIELLNKAYAETGSTQTQFRETAKETAQETAQVTAATEKRATALQEVDNELILSMIREKENGIAIAANYAATINQANAESIRAEKLNATSAAAAETASKLEEIGKSAGEAGEKADETKGKADEAGAAVEDALNPEGEGISGQVGSAISALQELQAQAEETAAAVSAALNAEHGGSGGSFGAASKSTTAGGSSGAPLVTAFGDTYNPLSSLTRHATGLPTVPFDGYLAMLHRGEAILTRREADAYRSGREEKTKDVTIVQNIQSVPLRPSELAAQTRHAFNSLRFSV